MGNGTFIIVTAAIIGGFIVLFNGQKQSYEMDREISQEHESQILARELALSGMNMATGEAHRNWDAAVQSINSSLSEVEQRGGRFEAKATELSSTAMDITVSGHFGTKMHEVRHSIALASPLDAPFIVDAPLVDPTFSDTFLIEGVDRRPPSTGGSLPPTAMDKPGLTTNLTVVRNHFGKSLAGNMKRVRGVVDDKGTIGSGSLHLTKDWEVDLEALYDEAVNHPDRITLPGSIDGGLSGKTLGSSDAPIIAHIPTNAIITGQVTGYGMLVIDGDVTISDNFVWEGIVLVRDETNDLVANYGGEATIYGSLIVMQGGDKDWAFTMPTTGRLKVTYKYSSAGFGSEVWVAPWGMSKDLIFERGSNRSGDQMDVYDVVFEAGQRMNFFINVEGCTTGTTKCNPKTYWDHYAAGHESPSGKPYGEVEQLDEYKWEIRFEDLPQGHTWEDWDYNDQSIIVEILPSSDVDDPWWTYDEKSEAEAEENPDSNSDGGTTEEEPSMGNVLRYNQAGYSKLLYSAEAIARLGTELKVIRNATRLVVVDQWAVSKSN